MEWVGPKGQLNLLWRFTRFKKETTTQKANKYVIIKGMLQKINLGLALFTASNIISMEMINRIIFFLFNINPKIPIKNSIIERFIIYIYYFILFVRPKLHSDPI